MSVLKGITVLLTVALLAACGESVSDDENELPVLSGVGPGITVSEALDSDLPGPLLVNGFIVVESDGTVVLAEALAESFPPQAGGSSFVVEGLELETLTLESAEGVSWTDQQVQVLGSFEGDVFVVSSNVSA